MSAESFFRYSSKNRKLLGILATKGGKIDFYAENKCF